MVGCRCTAERVPMTLRLRFRLLLDGSCRENTSSFIDGEVEMRLVVDHSCVQNQESKLGRQGQKVCAEFIRTMIPTALERATCLLLHIAATF